MSHVIINFAEHVTESITNTSKYYNSSPFSVNFFHPANMFRNSKVKQRSAKQINEKMCMAMLWKKKFLKKCYFQGIDICSSW